MMNYKTTRTWAVILTAALALSLLLTACNTGSDTPIGDNSTPSVTDITPNGDNSTPTGGDETPGASDTTPPGTSEMPTDEKQYGMPTWADPSTYEPEMKAEVGRLIEYYGELYGVDIDKLISEIIDEYGQYIDIHITPEAVRTAIVAGHYVDAFAKRDSRILSCLPDSSIKKANDFLTSNGLETFDPNEYKSENDVKKDLACLAIAASIYYEPNYGLQNPSHIIYDVSDAFSKAYSGTGTVDNDYSDAFDFRYYLLTD